MDWSEAVLQHEPDQIAAAALIIASVTMLYTVWYPDLTKTAGLVVQAKGNNKENLDSMALAMWQIRVLILSAMSFTAIFACSAVAAAWSISKLQIPKVTFDPVRACLVGVDLFGVALIWSMTKTLAGLNAKGRKLRDIEK